MWLILDRSQNISMHTHIANPYNYKIPEDKFMITWFIIGVEQTLSHNELNTAILKKDQEMCLYLCMIETGKIFRLAI